MSPLSILAQRQFRPSSPFLGRYNFRRLGLVLVRLQRLQQHACIEEAIW
jgi:hypothetical protein